MEMSILEKNTVSLDKEIQWFQGLVERRVQGFFNSNETDAEYALTPPPDVEHDDSNYGSLVKKYNLGLFERALLILTLLPHIKPEVLDIFYSKNANYNREFTEFGGLKGNIHVGFLPTAETAAFVLAGKNLKKRFALQMLLEEASPIRKNQIIIVDNASGSDPFFSRPLRVSKEFLSFLTTGQIFKPDFSPSFPAALLTTKMDWDDLVLDHDVLEEVEEIYNWIKFGDTLLNTGDLGKKLKKGYRGLFFGPPGTGKTLTATLLGKSNGLDVYRIDLSMVVSKYIGETEKNLSSIFDMAENKNWILFFDEADSLFGKRTATKDSKDRYANQEISYLLQRIEDFPGIIILATNLKANIDDAFARRFQSMIYFPIPSYSLRVDLWKKAFGKDFELDSSVDIHAIAKSYELSGGAITNVLRYCGLKAISRGSTIIVKEDILAGIRKELLKEGKTI
jgi:hypothetical protein